MNVDQINCKNKVIIFDDADSAFQEVTALNLLKAATDHKEVREVSWISTKNDNEHTFQFEGKVIIITNVMLSKNPHYKAMLDRMISYDPDITLEERLSKIEELAMVNNSFQPETGVKVINYLKDNFDKISDISLRTYIKIAQLVESIPDDWEDIANFTMLD